MNKKTVRDIELKGKKVLVRVDFNVPMDEEGKITDENRIKGAMPTIRYLQEQGARVILCSHLGRPKGEFNKKYSLAPVAKRLSELLGKPVKMALDVVGEERMRSDNKARLARGDASKGFSALADGERAGEDVDTGSFLGCSNLATERQRTEQVLNSSQMLPGENFCGGKKDGLATAVDNLQHRTQRNDRFSGADVALE